MAKIKINDITVRDIFQNIDGKHISEKVLDRIMEQLSRVKFDSLEIFGGSAFEKMLENNFFKSPFEIVYDIKNKNPGIILQALIGARNLVGMEIYSNDIIRKFISQCSKSGITRFKVFDALNDVENFKFTISTIREKEGHAQGTIIFDDFRDIDFYLKTAQELADLGCQSICIKDVESTLLPQKTGELFKALTSTVKIPFYLTIYNLRGLQVANYYNACICGCSGIDLSFIPSSYNDLNPAVFAVILSFKETGLSVDLDYLKLLELFEWFKQNIYPMIRNELLFSRFLFSSKNINLAPKWLLSSINNQLAEIGESNKIDLVLEELFKIKNEIGNPSLATPIGQIIGSQAILNTIISDYRWEITNDEIKKLISGYYGRLSRDADPELLQKIGRFPGSTSIAPGGNILPESSEGQEDKTFEQCAHEISGLSSGDGDVLSYLFFPEKTLKLMENRKHPLQENTNGKTISAAEGGFKFPEMLDFKSGANLENIDLKKIREITNLVETSNIDEIKLEIDGVKISINKKAEPVQKKPGELKPEKSQADESGGMTPVTGQSFSDLMKIKSPIVGTFYSSPSPGAPPFVSVGSRVKKGDVLCIIEAMKLMNKINSDYDGEIVEILLQNEEAVEFDQVIMTLRPES